MSVGNLGVVTLPRALGVSGWLLVALFWEIGLVLFVALERRERRPASVRPGPVVKAPS